MKKSFCQSCGMPIEKDPKRGGTEKGGVKTIQYCSYCYAEGEFLSPKIDTPEKMQQMCIQQMSKQGTPKWLAWIFTRGIPRLDRWK